jgi:hypothetical protein
VSNEPISHRVNFNPIQGWKLPLLLMTLLQKAKVNHKEHREHRDFHSISLLESGENARQKGKGRV